MMVEVAVLQMQALCRGERRLGRQCGVLWVQNLVTAAYKAHSLPCAPGSPWWIFHTSQQLGSMKALGEGNKRKLLYMLLAGCHR